MQSLAILGRQSKLGLAELEQLYGSDTVRHFSPSTATVEGNELSVERLGGSLKVGRTVLRFKATSWADVTRTVVAHYSREWRDIDRKQTLGISVYDWNVKPRDIAKLSMNLKSSLKKSGVSLRTIPNKDAALNTAVSHHNKLGLSANKTELLITRDHLGVVIVAESTGAQNITALAARDQARPKTDAFVGMLPPKLALMMINLSGVERAIGTVSKTSAAPSDPDAYSSDDGREAVLETEADGKRTQPSHIGRILDPFCGTGVVLQEAALLGYDVYGTDLSEKMVDYSTANLEWLQQKYRLDTDVTIHHGDAMETRWSPPIDAVVAETYLGQPFSAPPSAEKLAQVRRNCNDIISKFLRNLHGQIPAGTKLCLAVPAWRDSGGRSTHLPLIRNLDELGYTRQPLKHVSDRDLLYFREDQVVARELLVLTSV